MLKNVEAVGEVANTVNSFGVTVTIISVFIIIFLAISFYIIKETNQINKATMDSNKLLIDEILSQNKVLIDKTRTITEGLDKFNDDEKGLMRKYIEINSNIRDICSKFIDSLDAERIAVYVFHNGSSSTHGLPFFKMSCISEYVSRGNISRLETHLNIPLNLFDDTISLLYTKKFYYISESDLNANNLFICKLLPKNIIKSCALYAMYDSDNVIIGIVVAEYSVGIIEKNLLSERKKLLHELSSKIGPIIEYSEYNDNFNKVKMG